MRNERPDQYQTAIQLLRLIQADYGHARKELQEVSLHFAKREASAVEQFRVALDALAQIGVSPDGRHSVQVSPKPTPNQDSPISRTTAQRSALTLQIYCLGRYQVHLGQQIIERWSSGKAKSLLKYLVSRQGRRGSKDVLMEALWPGCEPSLANNNLKAAVKALRQTLNFDDNTNQNFAWVLFQDGNYLINPESPLWIDVDEFEYHWSTGRQLENKRKVVEAINEYKAAAALYKGDYLEDDLYEEWTSFRREALEDEYLAILGKLSDYSMQQADYDGCIAYSKKILSKDICSEDAYSRLMCCHSRLGQRNRAISWYRLCENTIKKELDVSPDQRTAALYQKILNGEYI